MADDGNQPLFRHVYTVKTENLADPSSPVIGIALFQMADQYNDKRQEVQTVTKHPLTTLLQLTAKAEQQGYAMPVNSESFTNALSSILSMETIGRLPDQPVLALQRPRNALNREVPTA